MAIKIRLMQGSQCPTEQLTKNILYQDSFLQKHVSILNELFLRKYKTKQRLLHSRYWITI